jgi:hypothetical protein
MEFRKLYVYLKNSNSNCNKQITDYIYERIEEFAIAAKLIIEPKIVADADRKELKRVGIETLPVFRYQNKIFTGAQAIITELERIGHPEPKSILIPDKRRDEDEVQGYMQSVIAKDDAKGGNDDEEDTVDAEHLRAGDVQKRLEAFMSRRAKPPTAGHGIVQNTQATTAQPRQTDHSDDVVVRRQRGGAGKAPQVLPRTTIPSAPPAEILRRSKDADDELLMKMFESTSLTTDDE